MSTALSREIASACDVYDNFGHIHDLKSKVRARARRVVERAHGDHPLDELLDILGLTQETP